MGAGCGSSASSRRSFIFEVSLHKGGGPDGAGTELGVDVLQQDQETLLVSEVKAGLVAGWNVRHPDCCVLNGDRIVQVNGVHGSSRDLIDTIRANTELRIRFRRILEYAVVVQRPPTGRLGLDVVQY